MCGVRENSRINPVNLNLNPVFNEIFNEAGKKEKYYIKARVKARLQRNLYDTDELTIAKICSYWNLSSKTIQGRIYFRKIEVMSVSFFMYNLTFVQAL